VPKIVNTNNNLIIILVLFTCIWEYPYHLGTTKPTQVHHHHMLLHCMEDKYFHQPGIRFGELVLEKLNSNIRLGFTFSS